MHDIQTYQAEDGSDPYARWLAELADRQARARVLVGGDKRRPRAGIAAALRYWQDWQRRNAT